MSAATERVAEFLRQWAMMRDKSDLIYGVLADPDADETADLLAADLHTILNELDLFEQIFTGRDDRALVTLRDTEGFKFQASAPEQTHVIFAATDDGEEMIDVHRDEWGYVHVDARPNGLDVTPMARGIIRVRLVK